MKEKKLCKNPKKERRSRKSKASEISENVTAPANTKSNKLEMVEVELFDPTD